MESEPQVDSLGLLNKSKEKKKLSHFTVGLNMLEDLPYAILYNY